MSAGTDCTNQNLWTYNAFGQNLFVILLPQADDASCSTQQIRCSQGIINTVVRNIRETARMLEQQRQQQLGRMLQVYADCVKFGHSSTSVMEHTSWQKLIHPHMAKQNRDSLQHPLEKFVQSEPWVGNWPFMQSMLAYTKVWEWTCTAQADSGNRLEHNTKSYLPHESYVI